MATERDDTQDEPVSAHVCVADLGSRPVEIQLTITLQGAKNRRGKPKVRVSVSECPQLKRRTKKHDE